MESVPASARMDRDFKISYVMTYSWESREEIVKARGQANFQTRISLSKAGPRDTVKYRDNWTQNQGPAGPSVTKLQ